MSCWFFYAQIIMRIGILILMIIISFYSCKNEVESNQKVNKKTTDQKEYLYQKETKKNKIKSKKAIAVQYKFGEPSDERLYIYQTNYNENGFLKDSIIFKNNKRFVRETFKYNDDNELIQRSLFDSLENLVSLLEREFDENGKEIGFKAFKYDTLRYSQKMTYNDKKELVKITDYYNDGSIKNVSTFSYNSNGDITSKADMNESGVILMKQNIGYDSEGRKVSESDYDSTGVCIGKTLIKKYDENDKIHLIEKYNSNDSLYARYEFDYDKEGNEIKNTIYNGMNQILRQSITNYNEKGNPISFKIYEGEVGLRGTDLTKYNKDGLEIELKVLDNQNKQTSRKVKEYNEKGLLAKEINFDKLDEPQFEFRYEYVYYE